MESVKICLEKTNDDLFMKSKWWGNPDVPQNFDVPDYLTFICQIRCDEIAAFDDENMLPHKGMLHILINPKDLKNKDFTKVTSTICST